MDLGPEPFGRESLSPVILYPFHFPSFPSPFLLHLCTCFPPDPTPPFPFIPSSCSPFQPLHQKTNTNNHIMLLPLLGSPWLCKLAFKPTAKSRHCLYSNLHVTFRMLIHYLCVGITVVISFLETNTNYWNGKRQQKSKMHNYAEVMVMGRIRKLFWMKKSEISGLKVNLGKADIIMTREENKWKDRKEICCEENSHKRVKPFFETWAPQ